MKIKKIMRIFSLFSEENLEPVKCSYYPGNSSLEGVSYLDSWVNFFLDPALWDAKTIRLGILATF